MDLQILSAAAFPAPSLGSDMVFFHSAPFRTAWNSKFSDELAGDRNRIAHGNQWRAIHVAAPVDRAPAAANFENELPTASISLVNAVEGVE